MSDILWSPGVTLENVEKKIILRALAFYQNNREETARSLGISRRTIDSRISDYNKTAITAPPESQPKRVMMGLGAIEATSMIEEKNESLKS
jgi:hypothetical protein